MYIARAWWHNRRFAHDTDSTPPCHANPRPTAGTRLTGTQSIERALTLLREIAAHNRGGSRLLDLATRTGLQRPTVHRMLKCLAAENMVQQDPDTHRYFLGLDGVRARADRRAALQPARDLPPGADAHRGGDRRHGVPHPAQRARFGVPRPARRHVPDQDLHARDRHAPPARRGHRLASPSCPRCPRRKSSRWSTANSVRLPEYGLNAGSLLAQVKRVPEAGLRDARGAGPGRRALGGPDAAQPERRARSPRCRFPPSPAA